MGREAPLAPPADDAIPSGCTEAVLHPVPLVKQAYNWDCGLACCLMVMRACGAAHLDMAALRDLCPTSSTWTIDLAFLLRQAGLAPKLLTVCAGVNQAYAGESFYQRFMAVDAQRVQRLFDEAAAAGVSVEQRSVGRQELVAALRSRHVAIILVDKAALKQGQRQPGQQRRPGLRPRPACGAGDEGAEPSCCSEGGGGAGAPGSGYVGHYLVLRGYDPAADAFAVADPDPAAAPPPGGWLPAALVDAARLAYGTDEDVLLVPLGGSGRRGGS